MESKNNIFRMKELISIIKKADEAYYGEDNPIMTDKEYDALIDELKSIETETGIIFANSPSKKVGGANKPELKKVTHSKPMLSAQKTKSVDDLIGFARGKDVMLSWKMDGLTLVWRIKKNSWVVFSGGQKLVILRLSIGFGLFKGRRLY